MSCTFQIKDKLKVLAPPKQQVFPLKPAIKENASHSPQHPIWATSPFKDSMERGLGCVIGHCSTLPTPSSDFCMLPMESELKLKI